MSSARRADNKVLHSMLADNTKERAADHSIISIDEGVSSMMSKFVGETRSSAGE